MCMHSDINIIAVRMLQNFSRTNFTKCKIYVIVFNKLTSIRKNTKILF